MSGQGDSNDGLWMLFFILAFICALIWGIWYLFKPQILYGYLALREGQMAVASLYTKDDVVIETPSGDMTFGETKVLIKSLTPQILLSEEVNHWQVIHATSVAVLKPLRIPFGIIFALMVYYAFFRGPTSHHRKTYGLDSLIDAQTQTFPVINPIKNFNPLFDTPHRAPGALVPAELPLFAEALSPEEWMAFHKIPIPDGVVDRDAVEAALKLQLGEPWQGVKKLPPYLQILLAAFALKTVRKRKEADDFLGEIAICWSHKGGLKLNSALISKARKILRNKDIAGSTIAECNRHAYVTTALLGALDKARSEGGVLAPATFLWMRGVNRALWYPLNNLGRQSFHAEAMGGMSHYRAEKQVQRPIPKPMVMDAVKVICAYIEDKKQSHPIPQLDFSMIKNKKALDKNQGIMKPSGT